MTAIFLTFHQVGFLLNSPPDYENPQDFGANNIYNLIVRATDISESNAQKNVAITVTDDTSDNVEIVISGSETVTVLENQNCSIYIQCKRNCHLVTIRN